MNEKWIVIREYATDFEAHLAKGALESNGVICVINNEIMSSVYPMAFSSLGFVKLLVRQEDEAQANLILEESEKHG